MDEAGVQRPPVSGTPFSRVWKAPFARFLLVERFLEELARRVGGPPVSAPPDTPMEIVAIISPCHRVIKRRQTGGYGGGLWRKQLLLDLERGGQEELFPVNPRRRVAEHA